MANKSHLISASSFYNLSKCQRRVWMDLNGDPSQKGEYSDFLELLWARGTRIEREIIDQIKKQHAVFTVTGPAGSDTFQQTLTLMKKGADWIYQGVLIVGDRIGRPDLLERIPGKSLLGDYQYIPSDIKSGRATTEKDGEDVKSHYANQMLFYCDLLEIIQGVRPETAKIIDAGGEISEFPISDYESDYSESKDVVEAIVYHGLEPEAIISGVCKECVWQKPCLAWAKSTNDPTLLFKLGKQKFPLRDRGIKVIADIATMDITRFLDGDSKVPRVGEKTLSAWKRRANVWIKGVPLIHSAPGLRSANCQVYYDIEDDPSIDHVYLHGIIDITDGIQKDYQYFLAPTRQEELAAAQKMWKYIDDLPEDSVIFHYGSYEKTKLRGLARKYNLSTQTLDRFERLHVDLYRVIEQSTDWPLSSYGVKPIAKLLGFNWTAEDASGANSIAWYTEFCKDPERGMDLLEKILTYNREDCQAMIIVKNFLIKTPTRK